MEPDRMRAEPPMRVSPATPGRPDGYPSSTPGSIEAFGPRWTSTAPGISHFNGGSARSHRRLDRDQGTDHAGAEASVGERRTPGEDRIHEIGALVLERLARLDLRADDVAVADQQ